MPDNVSIAFERRIIMLPIASILPLRHVSPEMKKLVKYRRIATSIAELGLVEPLVVTRSDKNTGKHFLLDGHLRLAVLIDSGEVEALCLVSSDDEAFTYNSRVNRLAIIQEHYMIVHALEKGVSEERLSKVLNMDVKLIRRRRSLLDRIAPEVIELFKDKTINPSTFDVLRRMKPLRQIEAAELMMAAANYSSNYAKALLVATRQQDLARPDCPKKIGGISAEQMAKMEREMGNLQRDFKAIESSYGEDIFDLVISSGFIAKIISNPAIERYLQRYHSEILDEFRSVAEATSLEQVGAAA
jgi:ParB-like chromosome segregation protein Spo0J